MNYSQASELEVYLDNLFGNKPGFFLEIGCWDGEHISQSAYLEREKGWKGLCVDPFPRNFINRTAMLCNKAVSADGLPREFIKVTVDRRHGGDVSYFSGFKDSVKTHWDLIRQFCDYEITEVDTITIPKLYEQYHLPQYIDFLSIDTEGSELEIISGINFDILKFGVIMYEHNGDENVRKHIGHKLERVGYVNSGGTVIDDIYTWSELK